MTERWEGERVRRWLVQAAGLERQLAPVTPLLMAGAAPVPGERVLDVGCGTGPTTRQFAALVAPGGAVTGLDLSADMIAAAAAAGGEVQWVTADAQTWDGPAGSFDLVASRFGVMFFPDVTAALTNLARVTRPGGRLAVAVWGRRSESPLFDVPLRAVLDVVRTRPPDGLGDEDGPFTWSDDDRVRATLTAAGWREVGIDPHHLTLPFAGGLSPAGAAAAATDFGPTRTLLEDASEDVLADARSALTEAFAAHVDAAGAVQLDATVRIVTATR